MDLSKASRKDVNTRLYIVVKKNCSEKLLYEQFSLFGQIRKLNIFHENENNKEDLCAYIKFVDPQNASFALKYCDARFCAKIVNSQKAHNILTAKELPLSKRYETSSGAHWQDPPCHASLASTSKSQSPLLHPDPNPFDIVKENPCSCESKRLKIVAPIGIKESFLFQLFDIVPGLEYCDVNETTGLGYARYESTSSATYAKIKLNNFKTHLGGMLQVEFYEADISSNVKKTNLKANTEPAPEEKEPAPEEKEHIVYSQIQLPLPKPIEKEKTTKERLFFVCKPSPIPQTILKDAFCRFGNLIDVFYLPGHNYGYAKYSSQKSAQEAMIALDGQTIASIKLKVFLAEPLMKKNKFSELLKKRKDHTELQPDLIRCHPDR